MRFLSITYVILLVCLSQVVLGCSPRSNFLPPLNSQPEPAVEYDWSTYLQPALSAGELAQLLEEGDRNQPPTSEALLLLEVPQQAVDQRIFWSVSAEGSVHLWELESGNSSLSFSLPLGARVIPLGQSTRYLLVQRGMTLEVFDLVQRRVIAENTTIRSRITSASFYPSEPRVLLGGADGKIYRWNLAFEDVDGPDSKRVERYIGHGAVVSALLIHPDGRAFFSGDWSGSLNVWLPYDEGREQLYPDEDLFGVGFFTRQALRRKAPRTAAERIEKVLALGRDFVLLSTDSGALELWRVRGLELLNRTMAHSGLVRDMSYSESAKTAASLGRDGVLRIWRIAEKENPLRERNTFALELASESLLPDLRQIRFLFDGRLIASEISGRILEIDYQRLEGARLSVGRNGARQSSIVEERAIVEQEQPPEELAEELTGEAQNW